jgi:ATP-dependent exoDNAse (exonuclease V) beta subunit
MRGRIEIVSASAGSGKTTRLSRELEEAVTKQGISPERIVATTFTTRAAAELVERGRQALLRAGRPEEADLFRAARIGTVNAVAGMIVSDFAFEAGVSPDLIVLDEVRAEEAFRRSLGEVVTRDDLAELSQLAGRFHELPWQSIVEDIAAAARTNHVDEAALDEHAEASAAGFLSLLDAPSEPAEHLDAALQGALVRATGALRERVEGGADKTKKTADVLDVYERALHRLAAHRALPWPEWASLAGQGAAARTDALCDEVRRAAASLLAHPQLREDCERAVRLCFGLARRTLAAYRRFKRERRAIDFVDQDTLALELLGRPEVEDALSSEIALVLVDEFQDTSPLQLALFLSLARIAPRSVWVGDQKQAIYGFRGSDPSLMEAVVGELLSGREPETLSVGRRSRAPLVRVTNALFVPPFGAAGLLASRVALSPASDDDAEELGPPVERWRLSARTNAEAAGALAAHVRHLLGDPAARVRDRADGEPRPLRPEDVAILCRRRDTCLAVAGALAAAGVGSEVARSGLLSTLEGRAVMAGLRLWVDGGDDLAAAEIARLTEPASLSPDALLRGGDPERFAGVAAAARLAAARAAAPLAGALEALDRTVSALRLDELCARHLRGRQGAANLDALRARAVSFVRLSRHRGGAASPAALVAHLEALAEDLADAQAQAAGDGAVTVTTWHAAKGLEWPVVILYELDGTFGRTSLGVHVDDARKAALRLDAPLAGRALRYWPSPFSPRASRTPFHERLARHPIAIAADAGAQREELRLLYVGWTRARDRLVLAGRGDLSAGTLALFAQGGGTPPAEPAVPSVAEGLERRLESRNTGQVPCPPPAALRASAPPKSPAPPAQGGDLSSMDGCALFETRVRWGGCELTVAVRRPPPAAAEAEGPPGAVEIFAAPAPASASPAPAPARLRPSEADERGTVLAVERLGAERMPSVRGEDPTALGTAVHGFFAADRPGLDGDDRAELATRLLEAWGATEALEPADLLAMGEQLDAWIARRWPGSRVRRELPMEHRLPAGTIVRGTLDLVIEHEAGTVVVDHKVLVADEPTALAQAAGYAGQLRAYAAGLVAAGARAPVETWIHLPLSGMAARVE